MIMTKAAFLLAPALLLLGAGTAVSQQAPSPAPAPQAGAPAAAPAGQDQAGGLVVDVEGGVSAPMPIAIPTMPTSAVVTTAAGSTGHHRQRPA